MQKYRNQGKPDASIRVFLTHFYSQSTNLNLRPFIVGKDRIAQILNSE